MRTSNIPITNCREPEHGSALEGKEEFGFSFLPARRRPQSSARAAPSIVLCLAWPGLPLFLLVLLPLFSRVLPLPAPSSRLFWLPGADRPCCPASFWRRKQHPPASCVKNEQGLGCMLPARAIHSCCSRERVAAIGERGTCPSIKSLLGPRSPQQSFLF